MTRVLLTGFEPFGPSPVNPSAEIVQAIGAVQGVELHRHVLPVVFAEATPQALELVAQIGPDVVIALGQAEGRATISLERFAVNLMDARLPDNAGVQVTDQPITGDGPTAYESDLPLRAIEAALEAAGIPVVISLSAGAFLCNHLFYSLQHALRGTSVRSGFVHLPLLPEQSSIFPGLPTMELGDQVRAIEALLGALRTS